MICCCASVVERLFCCVSAGRPVSLQVSPPTTNVQRYVKYTDDVRSVLILTIVSEGGTDGLWSRRGGRV